MWIAHSAGGGGWLSIVAHRYKPNYLMVRARNRDHILSIWANAEVYTIDGPHDYQFRADIPLEDVANAIKEQIESIEYDDYKLSVSDSNLYEALVSIWGILVRAFGRGPLN